MLNRPSPDELRREIIRRETNPFPEQHLKEAKRFVKVFVGNLGLKITEISLKNLFERFGKITEIRLVTDPETGESRGFAIVTMSDSKSTKRAIDSLNGTIIDERSIVVKGAHPLSNQRSHA